MSKSEIRYSDEKTDTNTRVRVNKLKSNQTYKHTNRWLEKLDLQLAHNHKAIRCTYRQTDKQTNRQFNKQTNIKQGNRKSESKTDKQKNRHSDRQAGRQ